MAAPTQTFNVARSIKVQNPVMSLDADMGPYDSVEAACEAIPSAWRKQGKEVRILEGGEIKPYCWVAGTTDADLVPFGGGSASGQDYTEEKLILQSVSFIPYATHTRKKVLAITCYLCSNVNIDGVALSVGSYLEADTVYSLSATMTADNAIIILKTEEA